MLPKMKLQTAAVSELRLKWDVWVWSHLSGCPAQTCQCKIGLKNLKGKENRSTHKSVSLKSSWFCWRSGKIFQHVGDVLNFLCRAPCILSMVKTSKCKCYRKIEIQICFWNKWWCNWFQWENMEPQWLKTIWQALLSHCLVICFPVSSVCTPHYF